MNSPPQPERYSRGYYLKLADTPRNADILRRRRQGESAADVAKRHGISPGHVYNLTRQIKGRIQREGDYRAYQYAPGLYAALMGEPKP